ncbi:MAG: dienelactone hydrolase family protein [Alphaproteobacteria bacterium]|nr:dienelactone hydrolase family protein [Alphaproteobacteria bacterium]
MPTAEFTIRTADGECPVTLAKPSGKGAWPGVIFFMDGIGYRPALAEMAERLAGYGYVVLLPDTFYRYRPYEPISFAKPPSEEERAQLMKRVFESFDPGRMKTDIAAFLAALDEDADVSGGPYGCTGYCMGGRWAVTAAGLFPERFAAAASFHGGGLATETPDSPHTLAGDIRAKVLVAGAEKDAHFDDTQKARLEAAFKDAGTDARVETWPALHGWTMADTPIYNKEQAERHWTELVKLFEETLKR